MPHFSGPSASSLFRYWLSDGRKEQLVAAKPQDPVAKAYPKLAADGQTLFYLEGPPSLTGSKLIRYDLASRMAKSIATVNHTYDLAPDGSQLVIPFFDSSAKVMIVRVIDKDGQPVRQLVRLQPEERVTSLAWSPDGKWIYFARGTRMGVEIHRVPATEGPRPRPDCAQQLGSISSCIRMARRSHTSTVAQWSCGASMASTRPWRACRS